MREREGVIKKALTDSCVCRSVFMWYMWRVEDVDTAVLE